MTRRAWRRAVAAALAALLLAGADAAAQAVSLHGGARMYDEGSAVMVAIRTEFPLVHPFLLEFSGSVADPLASAPRSAASVLEAQVQATMPLGAFTPYVGVGAGAAKTYTLGEEDERGEVMLVGGAGVRVALSGQLAVVVDARLRGIGTELRGDHTDLSVGLRYDFRRPDRPRFRGAPRR